MCFYYLFRYNRMNELERNPKKYIETIFHFLEDKGFQKFYHQVNGEESLTYEKDKFYVDIDYDCYLKMKYVNINVGYQIRESSSNLIKRLCIEDAQYKLRFEDYDTLNCMNKLNLVADYLSENLEEVMRANNAIR